MANYPNIAIHSCTENVINAEFVDITFDLKGCDNSISVTAVSDNNVNVFTSDITKSTARLNFSTKYTGTVKYTVMGKK